MAALLPQEVGFGVRDFIDSYVVVKQLY